MIAGHFGLAAAVKSQEKATPLWALMLATQWLDVVFVPLVGFGIEGLTPVAGTHGGYGEVVISADWTHSLLGALLLAATYGGVSAWRWGRRSGIVLGAVVFSHWLLDLVVHRHDMPMLPGDALHLPRVGFSLWATPTISIVVESVLVLAGTLAYWRAAVQTARDGGGSMRRANVAGVLALVSGVVTMAINAAGG